MSTEILLRGGAFFAVLVGLLVLEHYLPRRSAAPGRARRRMTNLLLVSFNTLVLRLLAPAAAVGWALWVQQRGWGLFPMLPLPAWLELTLGFLLLDMLIYWQHRLMHVVPLLWRLHRVHHSDLDYDVTTGVRFHPLEILFSLGIKYLAVAALGVTPLAVLTFELVLSLTSLWEHANLHLPKRVDASLRWFSVTPDMHRVHHSSVRTETDSNFGFNLPWWDYLFASYRAQPAAGHTQMQIGLSEFRRPGDQRLSALLLQPWRDETL